MAHKRYRPWTLRALRLVYESPEPVPKELVIYEAGRLVPPGVAYRHGVEYVTKNRDRTGVGAVRKDGRHNGLRIDLTNTETMVELGRREFVRENIASHAYKRHLKRVVHNGVASLTIGDKPLDLSKAEAFGEGLER